MMNYTDLYKYDLTDKTIFHFIHIQTVSKNVKISTV